LKLDNLTGGEDMKSSIIAVSAFSLLATASAVCAKDENIALFTKSQTNPFFQAVRTGADAAAKELSAKVIHYIPTKADSIPEQLSQVEDVIVKKPDAIVFIPVDYKAMAPGAESINAAKIPIVNITDRSSAGKFLSFVGADDYGIALETARYALKASGGKGNVVIIEGVKGAVTAMDRLRGFTDAIKEFKDVKLVASQPGNYQRLQALQVMENLMQTFPQIDVVLAANDGMAVGAIEALEGANRKAKVIGINGTKEAVDAIKAGKLLASGDYNGFVQGCLGTMIAIRSLRGEPIVPEIKLKAVVVDSSNFAPYDVPLTQRKCPSWSEVSSISNP
jgi:ribose transport system substrate-binding protein